MTLMFKHMKKYQVVKIFSTVSKSTDTLLVIRTDPEKISALVLTD